jgi:hypothetical protein
VVRARHPGGFDGGGQVRFAAGGQHVGVVGSEPADDRDHLLGGLARTEHGLRPAGAQRPMMVDPREAEVLERQGGQPGQGGVDVHTTVLDLAEQTPERVLIHWSSA